MRPRAEVFLDRRVYRPGDRYLHGLVQGGAGAWNVALRRGSAELERAIIVLGSEGAAEWLLPIGDMPSGSYEIVFSRGDEAVSRAFDVLEDPDETSTLGRAIAGTLAVPVQIVDPGELEFQGAGRWPVRSAVAMPQGAVISTDELALVTDGREVDVDLNALTWWGADCSSVRWVRVDFVAESVAESGVDGWSEYELVRRSEWRSGERPVSGEAVSVPRELALDPEAWGVPFVVDRAGRRFEPEPASLWTLDSQGGVHTTYSRRGWFVDRSGRRHSRFSTKMVRFASEAEDLHLRVAHRLIVTEETLRHGVRDAGWELPSIEHSGRVDSSGDGVHWATEIDGERIDGTGDAFLHQEAPGSCRLVGKPHGRAGETCGGWFRWTGASGVVTLVLRRMREEYPKEIEWVAGQPIVHFWPKHGREVDPRIGLRREHIHEARFAHGGETLEFDLPAAYERELRRLDEGPGPDRGWDAESSLERARKEDHGIGLAFGGEFHLFRSAGGEIPPERLAARVAQPPHALQPHARLLPSDASDSGRAARAVEISNDEREIERLLADALPAYQRRLRSQGKDLGMWIHGGVHNAWDPQRNLPLLHRVWQASHYRNVSGAWQLYARSGSPRLLEWARDSSRQFRDVHVLNHRTEHDPIGAMDHCKGFLPWAARSSVWGHWIDADALRLRWLYTGDEDSGELYSAWADALIDGRIHLGADREGVTTLGELLGYYEATADPRALVSIEEWGESVLARPFEEYRDPDGFPGWHRDWMWRYDRLTRDPRLIDRIGAWHRAGYGDAPSAALISSLPDERVEERLSQNEARRILKEEQVKLIDISRRFYDAPGEKLDGYGSWWGNSAARKLYAAPYALTANLDDPSVPSTYPSAATYSVERGRDRGPGLEIWILDAEDEPLEIRLAGPSGYGDLGAPAYRWLSPSGREIASGHVRLGRSERVLRVPSDGETGIYRLQCRAYRCPLMAPISSHPEAAIIVPGAEYRGLQRGAFWWSPIETNAQTVRIAGSPGKTPSQPQTATPAWFEFGQPAAPQSLASGRLFSYGERDAVRFEVPEAEAGAPWLFRATARFGPTFTVETEAPLVLVWPQERAESDGRELAEAYDRKPFAVEKPNVPIR